MRDGKDDSLRVPSSGRLPVRLACPVGSMRSERPGRAFLYSGCRLDGIRRRRSLKPRGGFRPPLQSLPNWIGGEFDGTQGHGGGERDFTSNPVLSLSLCLHWAGVMKERIDYGSNESI